MREGEQIEDNYLDAESLNEPTQVLPFYKPSLIVRIKSSLIDVLVVILLLYVSSLLLDYLRIESGFIRGLIGVLVLLYEPIATSLGQTLGQKSLGLRVRDAKTLLGQNEYKNIGLGYSILRYMVKILLGWLSLLTIHSNRYGQAIHDKVAFSVMTED